VTLTWMLGRRARGGQLESCRHPEVGVAAHGGPGCYLSLAEVDRGRAGRLRLAFSREPSVTRPRPAAKMSRLTRPYDQSTAAGFLTKPSSRRRSIP